MRTPRSPGWLALLVGLATALSCSSVDDVEIQESATAEIPGGGLTDSLVGDLGFGEFTELKVQDSEEIQNQGADEQQIDSVTLTSLTLSVNRPGDQDLTFLESVEFYIEADGLPPRRIARGGPFPEGLRDVPLTVEDVELKPYAISDSMTITSKATGHRPDQTTTIEADVVITVDVDVSGAACG